jgi:phosphate acyltransferase
MESMTIAVDAMGGDHAPQAVIEGVAEALAAENRSEPFRIILVGREKEIQKELRKYPRANRNRIDIVDAREAISMKDHLLTYWRKRTDTSIHKAIELVKNSRAQAMISAGNTGAVMAVAKTVLGSLPHIDRPALSVMVPTLKGSALVLDVGANSDSKPHNLVEFALMGKIYLETIHGIHNPRIGLMNIGEEEAKGNELTKAAHAMLKNVPSLNFIGNVEGRDIHLGEADLIVTDGFTGNITLKVTEGVMDTLLPMLRREIMGNLLAKIGLFFLNKSLNRISRRMDYAETGGALLLGVNGIVIIGHGRSSPRAIRNAIHLGCRFISNHVQEKIGSEIEALQRTLTELKYG